MSSQTFAFEQEEQSTSSGALLSDQWSGMVSTWHGDVPLNPAIASPHQVSVTVGENDSACKKAKVSSSRLGSIARGDLKTGETNFRGFSPKMCTSFGSAAVVVFHYFPITIIRLFCKCRRSSVLEY